MEIEVLLLLLLLLVCGAEYIEKDNCESSLLDNCELHWQHYGFKNVGKREKDTVSRQQ